MFGLKLRPEFHDSAMRGTVIELKNSSNQGATQLDASGFLGITYPSVDLLKCLEALTPAQNRTVVLMGSRGQGKSHMLATVYHSLTSPTVGKAWLEEWAGRLKHPEWTGIGIRSGFRVVAETLSEQSYKDLWEILWKEHADGDFYRGVFETKGVPVPAKAMLVEMFTKQPMALLLDEFQTWYDGLSDSKAQPRKTRAFNFIQTLSEIASEHPDKLLLVVSVRDGHTDAYQQIHRLNPLVVDFTDPLSKRDRHRLLLHRIFANRSHIDPEQAASASEVHFHEHVRLHSLNAKDAELFRGRVLEAWPFSPTLLDLLDDQVLVASHMQQARDLIKLLVETYKLAGESSCVLTAADFRIDEAASAVGSMLSSVANPLHRSLREKAQKNLESVMETVPDAAAAVPHAARIISSLWLRSFNTERHSGAAAATLQVDLTRDHPLDDNAFAVELKTIREASFNIHEQGADWLIFKNEVNPEARLMAHARNEKLFPKGEDLEYLKKALHSLLAPDDQSAYRILVLPRFWQLDPWQFMAPEDQPAKWDQRIPIIVVPDAMDNEDTVLGRWLAQHLTTRRNTPRFLLPAKGSPGLYQHPELIHFARAAQVAAGWMASEPEYRKLKDKYDKLLRDTLKGYFPRFAVLEIWNHADPSKCVFQFTAHHKQGAQIPEGIQSEVRSTLFVPEDFDEMVLDFAARGESVGKLIQELREPRSGGAECIAWLGEREIAERVELLCAKGRIAVNLRGTQWIQSQPGETEQAVLPRIRGKIGLGSHLDSTTMHKPGPVGGSSGGVKTTVPATGLPLPPSGFVLPVVIPGTLSGPTRPVPPPATLVVEEKATRHFVSDKTSPLNLTGVLEQWAAHSPDIPVSNVSLRLESMTGAQLLAVLRKLPEGSYILELDREDPA